MQLFKFFERSREFGVNSWCKPSTRLEFMRKSQVVLLAAACLLLAATPSAQAGNPTYLFEMDTTTLPAHFPAFVAMDSSGNVYTTFTDLDSFSDPGYPNYDYVVKMGGNGSYLGEWGGTGTNNGQFQYPAGLAFDSTGNIYVVDSENERVQKFDSEGNYLAQWGTSGSGPGQFMYPDGIAIDHQNNVYVVDNGNTRIEKFDSNGNFLLAWGPIGSFPGDLSSPFGIAVDSSNNVYVTDNGNNRVEKYNSTGAYITQWSNTVAGSALSNPLGIAIDVSNRVYVADNDNIAIEIFDSNGNYLGNCSSAYPYAVTVDRTGNLVYASGYDFAFAHYVDGRIAVFANNTNILAPMIYGQPASQTVVAGGEVTFSPELIGTPPLFYQWTSNNVVLPNATNVSLTLSNVSLSDTGDFVLMVNNSFGSTTSSNATYTVMSSLVTTLPVTGIAAASAVLQGSVTVGPDATTAWFEWGTDTNYGNTIGQTVLPGDNDTVSVSNTLSGLTGALTYHYRLDASNFFGVAYGNDVTFQVGLIPSVTTLLPESVTTNSAALEASVDPDGLDTTYWFVWGPEAGSGNVTTTTDIGNGAAAINVNVPLTGLTPGTIYFYRVIASNTLGTVSGGTITFLVLNPSPDNMRWASSNSTVWTAGSLSNWYNTGINVLDVFHQGDNVLFDDTAGIKTNLGISSTGGVFPSSVTVNANTNNYTFAGSPGIFGPGNFVKSGKTTLFMNVSNGFYGGVIINGGTFKTGNPGALGSTNGTVLINNGGTLDVDGEFLGEIPVIVSGTGVGGNGAIINSGPQPSQFSALENVTLAGDTTFGGPGSGSSTGRWDIRPPTGSNPANTTLSTGGNPYNLTKVGANFIGIVNATVDPALGNIDIQGGTMSCEANTTGLGNPNNSLTLRNGTTFQVYNTTNQINKLVVMLDGAQIFSASGTNTIIGPVTLSTNSAGGAGTCTLNTASGTSLTFSNAISGPGNLRSISSGTLELAGTNTYAGNTSVTAGTLALIGSGSISGSASISVSSGATLDASGRTDGQLTLNSGQTLTGTGSINGNVMISPGATISPGSATGTLTVKNLLMLGGSALLSINHTSHANNLIQAASVAYGGTLSLTNLGGTLAPGDSFKIFNASTYSGSFSAVTPAAPGTGLVWDLSQLTNTGTVKVLKPSPVISTFSLSGLNLVVAGSNGGPGGTYWLLGSSNLNLPASNWMVIATNAFDSNGGFIYTNPIDPSAPQFFYMLKPQ
jgi:autotransporter-associated beta strand protein